jgi:dual oxidase
VSAEILMASELGCPIEMHRIPIEQCDEMYDPDCKGDAFMPFHRANYDKNTGQSPNSPREQVRKMSNFIFLTFSKLLVAQEKMYSIVSNICAAK